MIGDAPAPFAPAAAAAPPATPARGAPARAAGAPPGDAARPQGEDAAPAGQAFDQLLVAVPPTSSATTTPGAPDPERDAPADATLPPDPGATPWLLFLAQAAPAAAPAPAVGAVPPAGDAGLPGAAGVQGATGAAATPTGAQAMPDAEAAVGLQLAQASDAPAPTTFGETGQPGGAPSSTAGSASVPAPEALPVPPATGPEASAAAPLPLPPMHAPPGPTHVPAAAVATAPVPQPADPAAGYDDSFGTQVSWLAEQRIGQAEIHISPEHLGAIDIRLRLDGQDVRAEFHSAHAEVRQALEASLPRLREMLGQHGLQLAHAGVGHGHKRHDGTPVASGTTTASHNDSDAVPPPGFRRARGLLDVYA